MFTTIDNFTNSLIKRALKEFDFNELNIFFNRDIKFDEELFTTSFSANDILIIVNHSGDNIEVMTCSTKDSATLWEIRESFQDHVGAIEYVMREIKDMLYNPQALERTMYYEYCSAIIYKTI
jgi:hypothetical protein